MEMPFVQSFSFFAISSMQIPNQKLMGRVTKIEISLLSSLIEHPDLDSEFEHRDDRGNSEAFRMWFERYFKNAQE